MIIVDIIIILIVDVLFGQLYLPLCPSLPLHFFFVLSSIACAYLSTLGHFFARFSQSIRTQFFSLFLSSLCFVSLISSYRYFSFSCWSNRVFVTPCCLLFAFFFFLFNLFILPFLHSLVVISFQAWLRSKFDQTFFLLLRRFRECIRDLNPMYVCRLFNCKRTSSFTSFASQIATYILFRILITATTHTRRLLCSHYFDFVVESFLNTFNSLHLHLRRRRWATRVEIGLISISPCSVVESANRYNRFQSRSVTFSNSKSSRPIIRYHSMSSSFHFVNVTSDIS